MLVLLVSEDDFRERVGRLFVDNGVEVDCCVDVKGILCALRECTYAAIIVQEGAISEAAVALIYAEAPHTAVCTFLRDPSSHSFTDDPLLLSLLEIQVERLVHRHCTC